MLRSYAYEMFLMNTVMISDWKWWVIENFRLKLNLNKKWSLQRGIIALNKDRFVRDNAQKKDKKVTVFLKKIYIKFNLCNYTIGVKFYNSFEFISLSTLSEYQILGSN